MNNLINNDQILSPASVRYQICRELRNECDEPSWPIVAGHVAKIISEEYERDLKRCIAICQTITQNKKA